MRYFIWFFSKSSPNFSKLFISPQKNLIYLTFFILSSFSCSQVSVSEISKNKHTGDIYGKITISGSSISQKNVTVFIQGKSYSTKTDPNGYFFIPGISPGKYSVTVRTEGFADCTIKMVEVRSDSITIVSQHSLYEKTYEKIWEGIKIKRTDIRNRGSIKGLVIDIQTNKVLNNAGVFIEGAFFWVAKTDSMGNYSITGILPRNYNVKTSKLGFHQTKILNVYIKSRQSSLVDFLLINIGIPENPLPYKWEPHYLNK
ncbi:MAG: carboxypeptidase regulatory-like domain-containing protein [Bacteroidetes bacterium]|nr:carboxypeptidase regulatory-like domain-containing protein [Bacteroidota bacterium]